ncbi:hypothetical protein [Pelovirga terrestris]|uniref:DUF5666 domain-containing protein n=1 Tax=Pelovirga terrestris TaxID=2771352 RepID=A0A8J6UL63_9BACT|nr:hypothetical protein [Pelovirga terrestris]MBD1400682.1 hypothetical protein [Pelovirga terrestris]
MNVKITANTLLLLLLLFWAGSSLAMDVRTGTVLMGKHAGKYTMMLIEEGGEQYWIAANFIDIAVGDQIEFLGGLLMRDFHSAAMNHTFPEILLVTNIRISNQVEVPGDTDIVQTAPEPKEVAIPTTLIVQQPGQISVADLFATREDLAGKTVSLTARVIRVSSNIQGKNWIALADGTGSEPDNQVMTVTSETANLGDVVTATGILRSDHTVGMGHSFKVLLEDAVFAK